VILSYGETHTWQGIWPFERERRPIGDETVVVFNNQTRVASSREPDTVFRTVPGAAPPRYSVLVPCMNEEAAVPSLVPKVRRLREALADRGALELVVIDDGSLDRTVAAAREAFEDLEYLTIVRHRRNLGLGAALCSGIGVARGSVVGILDADGTYDPMLLVELFAAVEQGAAIATASPYHPRGTVDGSTRFRLFLSRSLSRAYSLILGSSLYTYTACMRAYRMDVALRYRPERNRFDAVAEMLTGPLLDGLPVVEVPAHLGVRKAGQSKLQVGREVRHHLRMLFQIAGARWARRRRAPEER
jgi:dolichol-phosphate mannosyltransferase